MIVDVRKIDVPAFREMATDREQLWHFTHQMAAKTLPVIQRVIEADPELLFQAMETYPQFLTDVVYRDGAIGVCKLIKEIMGPEQALRLLALPGRPIDGGKELNLIDDLVCCELTHIYGERNDAAKLKRQEETAGHLGRFLSDNKRELGETSEFKLVTERLTKAKTHLQKCGNGPAQASPG